MSDRAFVPDRDDQFYLLRAHRQPLPANVAANFIEAFTAPGDLILDPFAASDALVRAAIARGRRIVATDSNPLVAWAARMQATLPGAREIHAALARLGETRREDKTLRAYFAQLFASQCTRCGSPVVIDYFVHRRVEQSLHASDKTLLAEKIYACAQCGPRRDDATEADRERAADAAPRGLTYHLLVERLIGGEAAHSHRIKKLLALYTPRNLSALAVMTQKLDAEFRDDPARNILAALMLHALDTGTSLYPAPDALPVREIPPEFIEVNVWRALETAAQGLGERGAGLRVAAASSAVVQTTAPAAFIGPGGARLLAENTGEGGGTAALVLSSPARLDPQFWELSFLWTRWLFGKTTAAALEPLMDEKRQRWSWYGEALTNALADAVKLARADARLVMAFPSGSHAMIEALMLAASPSFALEDFAFRPARGAESATEFGALRGDYQIVWRRHAAAASLSAASQLTTLVQTTALQAAKDILAARNEPLAYSWLHHAALDKLARSGTLAALMNAVYREGDNAFQFLRHRMEEGFKLGYVEDLDHWQDKTRVLWMKRELDDENEQFVVRVEQVVRETLRASGRIRAEALEDSVLEMFPGLLTPEVELVELCVRAYADLAAGMCVWRNEDVSAFLARARSLVVELGARLGFQVIQDAPPFDLIWRVEKIIPGSTQGSVRPARVFEDAYAFLFRRRAEFQELLARRAAPRRGLVVIPESQVELTRERLRREPRWGKRLERAGWDFLRAPFVEKLLGEEGTERPEFELAPGLDPPWAQGKEQLGLF